MKVILDGLQKFDQFDTKQQKQFLRTACKQVPGISWGAVKNKPLADIKSFVEKHIDSHIQKQKKKLDNIPLIKPSVGKSFEHHDNKEGEFSRPFITDNTTKELSKVLNEGPEDNTFAETEQGKIEQLKQMVQAHENFDISQETQAKIKTLEGARQYFSDFLKELKDHQTLKKDPTLTEGKDYLSDEGMLKFIIIPMLKMYEKLPTPIKTDQEFQDLIKIIRKTSISYVPDV